MEAGRRHMDMGRVTGGRQLDKYALRATSRGVRAQCEVRRISHLHNSVSSTTRRMQMRMSSILTTQSC